MNNNLNEETYLKKLLLANTEEGIRIWDELFMESTGGDFSDSDILLFQSIKKVWAGEAKTYQKIASVCNLLIKKIERIDMRSVKGGETTKGCYIKFVAEKWNSCLLLEARKITTADEAIEFAKHCRINSEAKKVAINLINSLTLKELESITELKQASIANKRPGLTKEVKDKVLIKKTELWLNERKST